MSTTMTTTAYYYHEEEHPSFYSAKDHHSSMHESSILNLTTDDDESGVGTPLNQSMEQQQQQQQVVYTATPNNNNSCCEATTTTLDTTTKHSDWSFNLLDTSNLSLANVTDSIVNGLCSSNTTTAVTEQQPQESRCLPRTHSNDFLSLLGCVEPPTDDELVHVWPQQVVVSSSSNNLFFEKRATPQERAERKQKQSHHAMPLLKTTRSMDDAALRSTHVHSKKKTANSADVSFGDWLLGTDHDPLEQVIGKGLEPILPEETEELEVLSYDSDPEDWEQCWSSDPGVPSSSNRNHSLLDDDDEREPDQQHYVPFDFHRARIAERAGQEGVLETHSVDPTLMDVLNSTFHLTLHPPHGASPTEISVWMERGTMLNRGQTIVEPKLMWRKRRLSNNRLSPVCQRLRLLEICRITQNQELDRRLYPYAMPTKTFLVKTCHGDEFCMEASSSDKCRQVVEGWKLCVARLASLAVVEDMETMALEFFTTSTIM